MSLARQQLLSQILQNQGFEHFGFTGLQRPLTLDFYKEWLEAGHHGSMEYLARHLPKKEHPQDLLPRARSLLAVGITYIPHPKPHFETPLKKHGEPGEKPSHSIQKNRIAYYARGQDYHLWLKEKLELCILELKQKFPDEVFMAATDSSPILERDWAYQAGLGWFGKNTCLIDQKRGSFFLIGEILTSLALEPPEVLHPNRCGTCTRCIDACPTQAIIEPYKLDARRCISYLTIESKELPPLDLRKPMGDFLFGCDICQTVCPWNEKVFGAPIKKEQSTMLQVKVEDQAELIAELRWILTSSNGHLEKELKDSPLARARGFGLKRNALIVAANRNLTMLRDEITALCTDPRLGELASWALKQLSV